MLLPLWLQQFMGYTATDAGMVMAPVGLLALVLSPIVGKTIAKVDPRRYVTFAFLVFALVLWMRSHFNTQADYATLMIPTIIQGVAMAFFFIPAGDHHLVGPGAGPHPGGLGPDQLRADHRRRHSAPRSRRRFGRTARPCTMPSWPRR